MDIKKHRTKKSKNNLSVPIVEDVHLHSIYDPRAEADTLLKRYSHSLEQKSHILVLGFGFGYHLEAIVNKFIMGKKEFNITVIEPNCDIVQDCFKLKAVDLKNAMIHTPSNIQRVGEQQEMQNNIDIYSYPSIEDLYCSEKLIDFLLTRPVIIPHPPSFNLYREYFTKYLTYKCNQKIKQTIETIHDAEAKDYFKFCNENLTLAGHCDLIEKGLQINEDFDFALLSFKALCKNITLNDSKEDDL